MVGFSHGHMLGKKNQHHIFLETCRQNPESETEIRKDIWRICFGVFGGQHQSLTYDFRDNSRILGTLAHDEMANVVLVRHAWLVDLLNRSTSFDNQLTTAKRFFRLERRFLQEFKKETSNANLIIVDLEDALADPVQTLSHAVDHMPKPKTPRLNLVPERTSIEGLDNFVRKLRNNGLNIDFEPKPRPKKIENQDAVFEKPYVVK